MRFRAKRFERKKITKNYLREMHFASRQVHFKNGEFKNGEKQKFFVDRKNKMTEYNFRIGRYEGQVERDGVFTSAKGNKYILVEGMVTASSHEKIFPSALDFAKTLMDKGDLETQMECLGLGKVSIKVNLER
jgi:hypothetical protein